MPLAPPQKHEVLPEAKGLLDASSLASTLVTTGAVVVTEGDTLEVEEPVAAADGSWWRAVLMPVINGLAAPTEYLDRVRGFRFRLRMDVMPPQKTKEQTLDDIGFDAEQFLEGAHYIAYSALDHEKISLDKADPLYALVRRKAPGPMLTDREKGFKYMTAEYVTVLGPTS